MATFIPTLYIPFTSFHHHNSQTRKLSPCLKFKQFKFNSSVCKMTLFSTVFSLILLFTQLIIGADADYHAITIFLNCGGPPVATDNYGREWTTDVGSKFSSPGGGNSTILPAAATLDPVVPAVPYKTARVFRSPFTYTFPVAPGRISLSLYFYLSSYGGLNISNALFTVTTQSSTLLNNFSPAMEDTQQYYGCIVKEYLFDVEGSKLSMTFTPAGSNYAFVNGIEVVSFSATPGPIADPQPQQGGTDDEPLNSNSKDNKRITDIALLLLTLVLVVLVISL